MKNSPLKTKPGSCRITTPPWKAIVLTSCLSPLEQLSWRAIQRSKRSTHRFMLTKITALSVLRMARKLHMVESNQFSNIHALDPTIIFCHKTPRTNQHACCLRPFHTALWLQNASGYAKVPSQGWHEDFSWKWDSLSLCLDWIQSWGTFQRNSIWDNCCCSTR